MRLYTIKKKNKTRKTHWLGDEKESQSQHLPSIRRSLQYYTTNAWPGVKPEILVRCFTARRCFTSMDEAFVSMRCKKECEREKNESLTIACKMNHDLKLFLFIPYGEFLLLIMSLIGSRYSQLSHTGVSSITFLDASWKFCTLGLLVPDCKRPEFFLVCLWSELYCYLS